MNRYFFNILSVTPTHQCGVYLAVAPLGDGAIDLRHFAWHKECVDVLLTWTCSPPLRALLKVARDHPRLDLSLQDMPPFDTEEAPYNKEEWDEPDLVVHEIMGREIRGRLREESPLIRAYPLRSLNDEAQENVVPGSFRGYVDRLFTVTTWDGAEEEYIVLANLQDDELGVSIPRAGFRRTEVFDALGDLERGQVVKVFCSVDDIREKRYVTLEGHPIEYFLIWPTSARRCGMRLFTREEMGGVLGV